MILTALILIIYCVIALIGAKKNTIEEADCKFFSKDYSTVIKGLCCVIVVFVHVPDGFKNTVQDLIGSFAYICVTIFFMLSAYGLRYSFENKEGYSKTFFKNRVLVLLVPYIISCLLKVACGFSPYSGGVRFVYVLLLFYIITFIAYNLPLLKSVRGYFICGCVLLYSLVGYLTGIGSNLGFSWNVEALGFVYGFLLADRKILDCLKKTIKKYTLIRGVLSIAVALIAGVAYLRFKNAYFFGEYLLRIVLGIAIISVVLLFTYRVYIGNAATRFLGQISYYVFLIHGFVMNVLSVVSEWVIKLNSGVFIMMTFVFTMVFAYLFNLVNTRITKAIKGIGVTAH